MISTLGPNGAALIKSFETCAKRQPDGRFSAYPDPRTGAAPWTIGWGSTGLDIGPKTIWTQAQCDARFARDTAMLAAGLAHMLGNAPTTQNQFDALLSFAYNVGLDDNHDGVAQGLGDSTLFAMHKAANYAGAQAQFARWNKAKGVVMAGLTRRRAAEAALYGKKT